MIPGKGEQRYVGSRYNILDNICPEGYFSRGLLKARSRAEAKGHTPVGVTGFELA